MKSQTYETEEAWLEARRGKITGTVLGKLFSKRDKKPLTGYYELIAERIALPPSDENVMDRGHRLEDDAIARFAKETGKIVETGHILWMREDNESIAVSPDGVIGETEACEVKCLKSAHHIEAWLTKEIPSEYEAQILQYFIVNEKLQALYFIFYDPRMPKDFFYFTRTREDVQGQVEAYLELEQQALTEIAKIEDDLTF